MLHMLGISGFPPGTRLVVGAALLALGFWRHSTLALVAGGVVLAIGLFSLLGGSRPRHRDRV